MNGDGLNPPRRNKQYFSIHQELYGISFETKECSVDPSRSCIVKYDVYTYTWGQPKQNARCTIKAATHVTSPPSVWYAFIHIALIYLMTACHRGDRLIYWYMRGFSRGSMSNKKSASDFKDASERITRCCSPMIVPGGYCWIEPTFTLWTTWNVSFFNLKTLSRDNLSSETIECCNLSRYDCISEFWRNFLSSALRVSMQILILFRCFSDGRLQTRISCMSATICIILTFDVLDSVPGYVEYLGVLDKNPVDCVYGVNDSSHCK